MDPAQMTGNYGPAAAAAAAAAAGNTTGRTVYVGNLPAGVYLLQTIISLCTYSDIPLTI